MNRCIIEGILMSLISIITISFIVPKLPLLGGIFLGILAIVIFIFGIYILLES